MAVHVLLNEIGASFSLERASDATTKNKTPEFLKANPRGQVPVLVEGHHVIREGGAILSYLCDAYKSELLPHEGVQRAEALEWLMFANATLHPAYSRCFWLMNAGDDQARSALMPKAVENINKLWAEVEERLQARDYICGSKPTIGDILLTVIANWSSNIPHPINIGPKTRALFKRVINRPAYQKALTTEHVTYKEAA